MKQTEREGKFQQGALVFITFPSFPWETLEAKAKYPLVSLFPLGLVPKNTRVLFYTVSQEKKSHPLYKAFWRN